MRFTVFSVVAFVVGIGCVDQPRDVISICGEPPARPGVVAAFDDGMVTMSRQTYLDLDAWSVAMKEWSACAVAIDEQ